MRKISFVLSLLLAFGIIPLYSIDNIENRFESKSARIFSTPLLPFREYFLTSKDVKSLRILSYENDFEKEETIKDEPNEYLFNEFGKIVQINERTTPVVEIRTKFFYNDTGFLNKIINSQYTYNQLYKEKEVIVLRLQDRDNELRIIQKELQADEKISIEEIRFKEDRLFYMYNDGGYEKVDIYNFDEEGLLKIIEHSSKYLRLKNQEAYYTSTMISYNEAGKIIEYRVLEDNEETINYYSFEYNSKSELERIIETDYEQDGQYKRVYNFNIYDTNGNWLEMREDIYSWGDKVSEFYIERQIEYWD